MFVLVEGGISCSQNLNRVCIKLIISRHISWTVWANVNIELNRRVLRVIPDACRLRDLWFQRVTW